MLLTSTDDTVKWWKEHFKDLLNPTVMLSIMKTESGGEATDIVYRVVTILEFQSWYGDPRKYSRKYSWEDFDQV